MFRCEVTGKVSKSGEKPVRIVTKTRPKQYFKWDKGVQTLISTGWEIVEEKIVLPSVAKQLQEQNAVI